jgi:hypothetical protein
VWQARLLGAPGGINGSRAAKSISEVLAVAIRRGDLRSQAQRQTHDGMRGGVTGALRSRAASDRYGAVTTPICSA